MKNLKFRYFDRLTGKMKDFGGMPMLIEELEDINEREGMVVMQSTGLKDVEEKEIFEGDIVDPGHADGKLIVVTIGEQEYYEDYGGIFIYYGCNLIVSSGYPRGVKHNYKIVGNIFQNPGLLEGEENAKSSE